MQENEYNDCIRGLTCEIGSDSAGDSSRSFFRTVPCQHWLTGCFMMLCIRLSLGVANACRR
jgi:hypothetical protein